jgi:hypothetical protein
MFEERVICFGETCVDRIEGACLAWTQTHLRIALVTLKTDLKAV